MQAEQNSLKDIKSQSASIKLDKDHGFFHSATFVAEPQRVFGFCRDHNNWNKILTDLPANLENFFDLELISAENKNTDEFQISWENSKKAKIQGNLTLHISPAPLSRGTTVTAVAHFDKFHTNDEEPSDLMNVFLKRMKALIETGVLATTKGQPSGREELQIH